MSTGSDVRISLRLRAAWHELTCIECRVTWRSWRQRLLNRAAGYRPMSPNKITKGETP